MQGSCPSCNGTNSFRYQSKKQNCPDDDFGHPALRRFEAYCLANIPFDYIGLDWKKVPFSQEHLDLVEDYVSRYDDYRSHGIGFEVFGKQLGIGKSSLIAHVLMELTKAGFECYWTSFLDMKNEILTQGRESTLVDLMMNVEHLAIDEILEPVTEKQGDFFESILEMVIRHRTSNNLPTDTTTNLEEEDMEHHYPRVYSLLSAKQHRIELDGDDYRKTKAFASNEELARKGERRPIF